MAILRAGPFAQFSAGVSDAFLDEPDTPLFNLAPVNCAKDDSSAIWAWKHALEIESTDDAAVTTYVEGLIEVDETSSPSSDPFANSSNVRAGFFYQAVEDFDIELEYNISVTGASSGASVQIDAGSFTDSDSSPFGSSASISGTETINLTAAVVPTFFEIAGSGGYDADGGTINITYSIS